MTGHLTRHSNWDTSCPQNRFHRMQLVMLVAKAGRPCKKSTVQLRVEPLEARELPATVVTAEMSAGILRIEGTPFGDTIHVREANGQVEVVGRQIRIGNQQVMRMRRRTCRGSRSPAWAGTIRSTDRSSGTFQVPATIDGGPGTDRLFTSWLTPGSQPRGWHSATVNWARRRFSSTAMGNCFEPRTQERSRCWRTSTTCRLGVVRDWSPGPPGATRTGFSPVRRADIQHDRPGTSNCRPGRRPGPERPMLRPDESGGVAPDRPDRHPDCGRWRA